MADAARVEDLDVRGEQTRGVIRVLPEFRVIEDSESVYVLRSPEAGKRALLIIADEDDPTLFRQLPGLYDGSKDTGSRFDNDTKHVVLGDSYRQFTVDEYVSLQQGGEEVHYLIDLSQLEQYRLDPSSRTLRIPSKTTSIRIRQPWLVSGEDFKYCFNDSDRWIPGSLIGQF